MLETIQNEFIETIRPSSGAELIENFRRISPEKTRVIVLIVESSLAIDESFDESLKTSEIPTILALKTSTDEKLVAACHLCIASNAARIGKFSAADALKSGLINQTANPSEVETEAFSLAEKISELAPLAIRACLRAVAEGFDSPLEKGLKIEAELFAQIFSTADMREGTRAFLEKRKPVFQGK
jgi:hypothetical protein